MGTALDARAFGLAFGLLWAAMIGILELTAGTGYGERWRRLLGDIYPGYDEQPGDLLWGPTIGVLDGFAWGYAFARLYNALASESLRLDRRHS